MGIFSKLLETGITSEVSEWKASKIKEANILSLIHLGAVIPFLISIAIYYPALLPAPFVVLIAVTLHFALLKAGFKNISRFFASVNGSLAVVWLHIGLLKETDELLLPLFSLQIAVAVVPWVVFDQREGKYLIGASLFNLLLFIFIITSDGMNAWDYDNALFKEGFMYIISLITAVLFLFTCLFLIHKANRTAALRQNSIISEMEKKQEDLEQSSIELNQYIDEVKKARQEDERRQWIAKGTGEVDKILRSNLDMNSLQDKLIKSIVKYSKSNQGGLFILQDELEEDLHLQLTACYAFDRKKHIQKRIEIGQGLAGQCYLEAESTLLTEIPEHYVNITSGLGEANPRCLILLPLIHNEKVQGVLELASFHKYEAHEIQYLEEIATSLASYIITLKTNERTSKLLEDFREQTETMRAQEEEMRQNYEELMATQEQMNRLKQEEENKYQELFSDYQKLKENLA